MKKIRPVSVILDQSLFLSIHLSAELISNVEHERNKRGKFRPSARVGEIETDFERSRGTRFIIVSQVSPISCVPIVGKIGAGASHVTQKFTSRCRLHRFSLSSYRSPPSAPPIAPFPLSSSSATGAPVIKNSPRSAGSTIRIYGPLCMHIALPSTNSLPARG